MNVSLKNIADALHLSKATVSWVLSGQGEKKGFSKKTIKLVENYAKEVGYQPNLVARNLSVGYTKTLGIIIPSISDTFYAQMVQAAEIQARKKGYVLIVCSSECDNRNEEVIIQTFKAQRVDGLIIASVKNFKKEIEKLIDESFPFVLIDRYFPELDTNFVIVNNEDSSFNIVQKLQKQGARKIVCLTTDMKLLVMQKRIIGYKKALYAANIAFDSNLFLEIDRLNYHEDLSRKLDILFESNNVDAFFFATHYLAMAAMRYFVNKKMDYNRLFYFGCIHTMEGLDVLAPNMLISRMPVEEMSSCAVNIVTENIKGKNTFIKKKIILSNELK